MTKMAFLLLTFSLAALAFDLTAGTKDVPLKLVEGLIGETIYLPCNVSTYDSDEVVLILWYREDKGTPIYSVDIRDGFTKAVRRWSDETVFGERAYFIFDKEPGALSIQASKYTDSGTYRCRVDFLKAQTRNSKITLFVIVPPEKVVILDDSGEERSTVVGPYNEDDMISLKCKAIGGNPIPQINWFRDDAKLDSPLKYLTHERYVQADITLGPLSRADLNSHIVCRASNHPRVTPIEAIVQIDMNFSPLDIRLLGAHQPLSAGRRYDLLCQSAGSRPPAVITWWLDGIRMEKTTETTSSDGNQTTSTLSFTFTKNDVNKLLTCKAYNHAVPSEPLEDGWKLDIQYIPETYVRLGTSLDPNTIKEGSDVYFDCLATSHPPVYRIEWRYNGMTLPRNISQGVIVSNHSLVLQGVTRFSAGNYTCAGFNTEGEGISSPFPLNILYAPTCKSNQTRIYGVAKQEDAKIKCSVDANPPDVQFNWTFNNSAESIDVATNHVSRMGTSSTVTYTPITELDYGTLLCTATNKIGKQRIPCVYHIIAAGRPDQVHNCTLTNISMTSLTVTCSDGFNGGLPQLFVLELIDTYSNEIKANITSTAPRFTVSTLSPGGIYTLSVYAFNSKGRSDPTVLNAAMLRMPEKQLTSEPGDKWRTNFSATSMVSLTVGLTSIILVAALAIILTLRVPCHSSGLRRKEFCNNHPTSNCSPEPSEKSTGSKELEANDDEKNPDVVPESMDPEELMDHVNRKLHVSTIESACSPSRGRLTTPALPQQYSSSITLHSSHKIGYCTLRGGSHASAATDNLQMDISPRVYSNAVSQCTLPRHATQHMWPKYNNMVVGVRHIQPLTEIHQQNLPNIAASSNCSPIFNSASARLSGTINLQQIRHKPTQHARISVDVRNNRIPSMEKNNMSDEEVTAQTPLMAKRGSIA